MKYLSLDWFKSKINKAVDKTVKKVVTEKIEKITDERLAELQEMEDETRVSSPGSDFDIDKEDSSLGDVLAYYMINGVLTIHLDEGQIIVVNNASQEDIDYLKSSKSDKSTNAIIERFGSEEMKKEIQEKQKIQKEYELIKFKFSILEQTGDFEVREDSVYLKGINRTLPKLLFKEFADTLERQNLTGAEMCKIRYKSLKKFWMKCCLNPNAQSAEDLYEFLSKHNMKIDKHGNFYTYRRVVSVGKDNKELVDFISNAYNKVKGVWKKSAKSYKVMTILDSKQYELKSSSFNVENTDYVCLGDLEFLYLNLPNMTGNRYTDDRTKSYDYRIGRIHSMPRNEGSDDNSVSCGQGFHQASKAYDYSGFGDQDILCIVNPISVLAVPIGEVGKLRVSDWFFAMTLDENERHILDEDCFDVQELGDIFEEQFSANMEERVRQGFAEEVKRHTYRLPEISSKEIKNIISNLEKIKDTISKRQVSAN